MMLKAVTIFAAEGVRFEHAESHICTDVNVHLLEVGKVD